MNEVLGLVESAVANIIANKLYNPLLLLGFDIEVNSFERGCKQLFRLLVTVAIGK